MAVETSVTLNRLTIHMLKSKDFFCEMKTKRLFKYHVKLYKPKRYNWEKWAVSIVLFLYIFLVWCEFLDMENYTNFVGK